MNIMSPAGFEWGAVSEPVCVTAQVVPWIAFGYGLAIVKQI